MAGENFELLKREYIQFHWDLKKQNLEELEGNEENNQYVLRSLIDRMEKSFPRKATEEESYMMFMGYLYLHPENRTVDDQKKWLAHTKRYVNAAEKRMSIENKRREKMKYTPRSQEDISVDFEKRKLEDKNLNERLSRVISNLPDITSNTEDVFNYTKKSYDLMSDDYSFKSSLKLNLEISAEKCFDAMLFSARQESTDDKKLEYYEKALKTVLSMPPIKRVPSHRECFGDISKIYQKTEYGKVKYAEKQGAFFSKVWKSLPNDVQSMYRQRSYYQYK